MEFTEEVADETTNLVTAELDAPPAAGTPAAPAVAPVPGQRPTAAATSAAHAAFLDGTQEIPRPQAPRASAPAAGSEVLLRGRYVLEAKIGEGGTSVVYRARDLRRDAAAPGGQRLALKLLRPGLRNHPRAVERLKREFHHAQTLSHPAIARVYDVDCDGGAWFLTLELLDGEPLSALLEREGGPLPARRALDILRACGDALAFAHERGVVHGDFKPGNVFITATGHVRVLDFGSASASWLAGEHQTTTATPAYASPEALCGQRPERRDDIFSFACVAYEMLSGRHPFDRRTALDARNAGRTPDRDWNLAARQWHALESGLAWSREERPTSIRALVADIISGDVPAPIVLPDIREPTAHFRPPRLAPFSAFAALAALGAVVFVAHSQLDDLPTVPEVMSHTEKVARELANLPLPAAARPPAPASSAPANATAQALPATADRTPPSSAHRQTPARTPGGTASESVRERAQRLAAEPTTPPDAPSGASGYPSPATPGDSATWADGPRYPIPEAEPASRNRSPSSAAAPAAAGLLDVPIGASAFVSFDVDSITVSEGASSAVLRINRRHQLDGRATVLWRTLAGSARGGADFREVARGSAEFADGQTTRAIYVPLLNDLDFERDETFTVELYSPDGMTRINPIPRVRVTVRDNDAANEHRVAEQAGGDTSSR